MTLIVYTYITFFTAANIDTLNKEYLKFMQHNVRRLIYSRDDISACLLLDMKTDSWKKNSTVACLNQSLCVKSSYCSRLTCLWRPQGGAVLSERDFAQWKGKISAWGLKVVIFPAGKFQWLIIIIIICSKAVKQVFSRLFIISEMTKKPIVALISKQLWPIISKSFLDLTDLEKGREGRRWPCCGHGAPYWAPLWVCITSAACEDTGWLAVRFVHIQRQRGKVAEHPSTGRRWESPKCRCDIGGRKTQKTVEGKMSGGIGISAGAALEPHRFLL